MPAIRLLLDNSKNAGEANFAILLKKNQFKKKMDGGD